MKEQGTILGHPKGVFLLSAVEVWERFSFYGMRAILVLFLVSATTEDGFAWNKTDAIKMYGYYMALVWFTPVVGGWIADQFLGLRRSLVLGGVIMAIGHFSMGGAGYFPMLIAALTDLPVDDVLKNAGLVLGGLSIDGQSEAAMASYIAGMGVISGQAAEVLQWSKTAYMGSSLSFYFALGLIILGNGLFKSPVATMVGMFYREAGAHKDAGYTLYYMAVNLGSFVAPLIVGLVGEYYGWHLGFTLAGIGMLCGLTLLLWKQRLLGEVGEKLPVEDRHHHMELTPLTSVEKQRLIALLVFIVFATLFIAAYEHTGGLMNLFLLDDTNRVIGDFVVPTTWFQSLNPLLVIAGAPVLAWLWVELAKLGRSPQMPIKFVIGFVVLAFSYLFMIFAALELVASADGKSGMLWVVLWYFFLTLAELIVLPLYYSSLNTMAPKRYSAMIMGCGLLALSIGSWLASRIGAWVVEQSYLTGFIFLALFTLGAATLPWALNTRLKRWMHLDHP